QDPRQVQRFPEQELVKELYGMAEGAAGGKRKYKDSGGELCGDRHTDQETADRGNPAGKGAGEKRKIREALWTAGGHSRDRPVGRDDSVDPAGGPGEVREPGRTLQLRWAGAQDARLGRKDGDG